jgi:hypothetical protein
LDRARLWEVLHKSGDVYAAMLIGTILIATPITILAYFAVKRLAERWARQRSVAHSSA